MKFIILVSSFIAASAAFPSLHEEWTSFKVTHGKNYASQNEEQRRLNVYLKNKNLIEEHNAEYKKGLKSYSLKMNRFGDMLDEEFKLLLTGYTQNASSHLIQESLPVVNHTIPSFFEFPWSVDWRARGFVTDVKDQGSHCGSCWAFCTTGGLEGQLFRKTGRLVSLSEQNLIDCVELNNGCHGGNLKYAYEYIKDYGISSEEDYPYEAADGRPCRSKMDKVIKKITGYSILPHGDEFSLMATVALDGPVSVGMDASPYSFRFHHKGVFSSPACDSHGLNHGVLVVGYGAEIDGTEYWIVKNSWGTDWGDNGYFKLARNNGNMCGIATMAFLPAV